MEPSAAPETPAAGPGCARPAGMARLSRHCAVGSDGADKPRPIVEPNGETHVEPAEERVLENRREFCGVVRWNSVDSELLAVFDLGRIQNVVFGAKNGGIRDDFAPEDFRGSEERRDEGELPRRRRRI